MFVLFFFFKQKTAYEMRISDWSSDVCSSDLAALASDRCARSFRLHPRLSRPDADAAADLCLQPDLPRLPRQLPLWLAHRALSRRAARLGRAADARLFRDRKSTRLNSSH